MHQYKVIGLGSLTSNILCATHNSAASPIDAEAGKLFQAMRDREALSRSRLGQTPPWDVVSYQVNGLLIERWLVRTAINLYHQAPAPAHWSWHRSGSTAVEPPDEFVEAAFGVCTLPAPLGLHVWAKVGRTIQGADGVKFTSLHDETNALVGAYLETLGLRLLIWLSALEPPADTMRHVASINYEDRGHPSQRLELIW